MLAGLMAVLMGRWCTAEQLPILEKTLGRFAEGDKGSAGVAALSAANYKARATILTTPVHGEPRTTAAHCSRSRSL